MNTQEILHPLTTVELGDIDTAKHIAEKLTNENKDFLVNDIKKTNSKSKTGKNSNLSIKIIVNSIILKEGKKFKVLNFEETVNYNSLDNKFELKQYEKIIIKDLTQKILDKIHFFLSTN